MRNYQCGGGFIVDLAFYANQQSDPYEIFLLANQLAMRLRKDVDLVDLKTAFLVSLYRGCAT